MNEEITIDKWAAVLKANIDAFLRTWEAKQKDNPADYPETMLEGDWDEQFSAYCYLKGDI
jgi:hypothetical protein